MSKRIDKGDESRAGRSLKILAVSDVVQPQLYNNGVKDWIGKVDLLVSCGDLPPGYLDFLISTLNVQMVHVLGNHCWVSHEHGKPCSPDDYPGAYDLNERVVEYRGLILAGLEGSPLYNKGPHQYTEQQAAWHLLKLYPALLSEKMQKGRYLDVMVTHAPPKGIHDGTDVAHRGFASLLGFIERFEPTLLLHGHTHRYDPMKPTRTKHGRTEIINVYGHALLDLVREENGRWRLEKSRQ
jgi:uncharacterized protein